MTSAEPTDSKQATTRGSLCNSRLRRRRPVIDLPCAINYCPSPQVAHLPVRTFSTSSRARLRRARPSGPSRAPGAWARESPKGMHARGEGAAPLAAGCRGSLTAVGRQLGPLPLARQRTGAGRCRRVRSPAPAARRSSPLRTLATAPARAAGPCSSRQTSCSRAKVTVTGPERRALSGSAPPPARAPEDPF
jgi:hypothetical protein